MHTLSPRALLFALMGVLAQGGCGLPTRISQQQFLTRLAQSLDQGDPQNAYRLLDAPTRRTLPYQDFADLFLATQTERRERAQALRRQMKARSPGQALAVLSLGDGTRVEMQEERGGWHLTDLGAVTVRPQTPEEAIRLLLAAAEGRSYAAVMRLLSPSQRQAIEAELRERIDRLRAALQRRQPLEVKGDRIRLQYDPRFFIELQRETSQAGAAGWRVIDLN
jgi:hypothetical protein